MWYNLYDDITALTLTNSTSILSLCEACAFFNGAVSSVYNFYMVELQLGKYAQGDVEEYWNFLHSPSLCSTCHLMITKKKMIS